MSEGLFAPLKGFFCLLGMVLSVLHMLMAQYFERSIGYIFHFPVKIPLRQSSKHRKANNDVCPILLYQMFVRFPPLGVLVAMLDGRTVGTT